MSTWPPGAVATAINTSTEANPAAMSKLDRSIPLGQIATAQQIADVAVFLASDKALYITATTVTVDGGMTQDGSGP